MHYAGLLFTCWWPLNGRSKISPRSPDNSLTPEGGR
jgi:hypothetical protein